MEKSTQKKALKYCKGIFAKKFFFFKNARWKFGNYKKKDIGISNYYGLLYIFNRIYNAVYIWYSILMDVHCTVCIVVRP